MSRVVIIKVILACENISFSSLFAAEDETSPAAKSEEERTFLQAKAILHLGKSSFSGSFRGLGGIFRGLSTIQGVLFHYSADSVFLEESLLTGVVSPIFSQKF